MGMPYGMMGLLERKYAIMQQQADTGQFNAVTNRTGVDAAANLDRVKAGILPNESTANIGLTRAQAMESDARKRNIDENMKWIGPLNKANISLLGANAFESRSRGGLLGAQTATTSQNNSMFDLGLADPLQSRLRDITSNWRFLSEL
jgi:hypothetical protein